MNEKIEGRKEAGNPDPRTPCRFIHRKSIVVKAQTGSQVPLPQSNLVLDVCGGFDVPAAVGKLKLLLRAGIKLRWISDLILQRFVHGTEDSVHRSEEHSLNS